MKYSLLENGYIHTVDLTLKEALELKKRYTLCFPNLTYSILKQD